MIPVWPPDLPQRVLADGYSEALPEGRLRTPMESGPPKTRRRFSSAARPVAATFKVSLDEKARLERFWVEDVNGGALPFLIADQAYDEAPLMLDGLLPLLDEQGRPLIATAWWLVLFGESPPVFTPRNRGMFYVAAFQLSVLP